MESTGFAIEVAGCTTVGAGTRRALGSSLDGCTSRCKGRRHFGKAEAYSFVVVDSSAAGRWIVGRGIDYARQLDIHQVMPANGYAVLAHMRQLDRMVDWMRRNCTEKQQCLGLDSENHMADESKPNDLG